MDNASLHSGSHNSQAGLVIATIEEIFESFVDCLLAEADNGQMVIELESRSRGRTVSTHGHRGSAGRTLIKFPGRTAREAWKFTVLVRILELAHEALVHGFVITKRDLFYRDPALFGRQEVVDRYVDDLARTFGVERDALNVVAAAKGLIAGSIILRSRDGSVLNCTLGRDGILIPDVNGIQTVGIGSVRWVLVVEKEATFRTLATTRYWQSSKHGSGILVTAKGYPDLRTREFLNSLAKQQPHLLFYGLFDFDPDGLGILSVYKHGSAAHSYLHPKLLLPALKWLGIKSDDFASNEQHEGLLSLSKRDRHKAFRMLQHHVFEECQEAQWRREIQIMLMLNHKAEIQILGDGSRLLDYLDQEMTWGLSKSKC